jgi:hypothetical protein
MVEQIQLKSETYSLRNHCVQANCTHGKTVALYFLKQKDLQQMKVFNYNDLGTDRFYLYSEGKYFSLNNGQGKLNAETDEGILSALDSKN